MFDQEFHSTIKNYQRVTNISLRDLILWKKAELHCGISWIYEPEIYYKFYKQSALYICELKREFY